MKFRLAGSADEFEVEIVPAGGRSVRVLINGDKELEAVVEPAFIDDAIVRFGRRAMKVLTAHNRNSIWVAAGSAQFEFIPVEARTGRRVHGLATPEITAPMPGKVVKIPVTGMVTCSFSRFGEKNMVAKTTDTSKNKGSRVLTMKMR